MKYLYKYPQAAFPYDDLGRHQPQIGGRTEPELRTAGHQGVFEGDRYFDVFRRRIRKNRDAEDILIRITVCNRGPEAAQLQVFAPFVVPEHLVRLEGGPVIPTLSAMHGLGNVVAGGSQPS